MAYATAANCKALSALSAVAAKTDADLDNIYIPRAARLIDAFTKNRFDLQSATTKRVTGSGSRMLILPERLAVMTTVTFLDLDDGGDVVLSSEEVKDIFNRNWYLVAEPNFTAPRVRAAFGTFPGHEDTISILGDWGYSSVPAEVQDATCLMVEKIIANETNAAAIGGQFRKERIGDYNYDRGEIDDQSTSQEETRMIPTEARMMLRNYHRPIIPRTP